jgi:hypothetical protein
MRRWIGDDQFNVLRSRLREEGFRNIKGEPDLFCWNSEIGSWFFAEAKRRDDLIDSQLKWFRVCSDVLGEDSDIRVYKLIPSSA